MHHNHIEYLRRCGKVVEGGEQRWRKVCKGRSSDQLVNFSKFCVYFEFWRVPLNFVQVYEQRPTDDFLQVFWFLLDWSSDQLAISLEFFLNLLWDKFEFWCDSKNFVQREELRPAGHSTCLDYWLSQDFVLKVLQNVWIPTRRRFPPFQSFLNHLMIFIELLIVGVGRLITDTVLIRVIEVASVFVGSVRSGSCWFVYDWGVIGFCPPARRDTSLGGRCPSCPMGRTQFP